MDMPRASSKASTAVAEPLRDALARPLHDLRISLLERCNFRCPYCMPAAEFHDDYQFLGKDERLTHDEVCKLVAVATSSDNPTPTERS